MAYNIYSQLQGPQIDVNLFPDAYSKGINAGNALPTPLTAGIQGAIKGLAQGESLVQGYQQIKTTDQEQQIRQHTIDDQNNPQSASNRIENAHATQQENIAAEGTNTVQQLGVQNRIQNAHAQIEEDTAQIQDLNAQNQTQNQQLKVDNTKTTLQADTSKNQEQIDANDQKNQLLKDLAEATPAERAQILLNPAKYPKVDPGIYASQVKQTLASAANDPSVDAATKSQLQTQYFAHVATAQSNSLLPGAQKNEAEADSALRYSPWANSLSKQLGNIPPEQVPSKIQMLPFGAYKTDTTGTYIQKTADGSGWQPDVNKQGQLNTTPTKNSFIAIDKSTGRILDGTGLLNEKDYDLSYKKNINNDITNGGYQNSLFNSQLKTYSDQQKAKQSNQTPSSVPTLNGKQPTQNEVAASTDVLKSSIQASLRLPTEHLDHVNSSIQDLKVQLDGYLAHPTTRSAFIHTAAISTTVNDMARAISDKQFDDNSAVQSMYTSSHVDQYSKQLAQDVIEATGNANALNEKNAADNLSWVNGYKATTPKDMFFNRQRDTIVRGITKATTDYLANLEDTKTSPARTLQASKASLSYLNSITNGSSSSSSR